MSTTTALTETIGFTVVAPNKEEHIKKAFGKAMKKYDLPGQPPGGPSGWGLPGGGGGLPGGGGGPPGGGGPLQEELDNWPRQTQMSDHTARHQLPSMETELWPTTSSMNSNSTST